MLSDYEGSMRRITPWAEERQLVVVFFPGPTAPSDLPALPGDWSALPNASGCTGQVCGIADNMRSLPPDVRVIFITTKSDEEIARFVTERRIKATILIDPAGVAGRYYGVPTWRHQGTGRDYYCRATLRVANGGTIVAAWKPNDPKLDWQSIVQEICT
jgi:peroxiredoxin